MKCRSLKLRVLFQVILPLSGALAFAGNTLAQQPPAAAAESAPKTVANVSMSPKEFAEKKRQLLKTKQVNKWAPRGTIKGQTDLFVVELTPQECTFLGGTVVFWPHCGDTYMKCVGSNGREMCISEFK